MEWQLQWQTTSNRHILLCNKSFVADRKNEWQCYNYQVKYLFAIQTFPYPFLFNESSIIDFKTFRSISSSLLMYKQPTPALCLPSFFSVSACSCKFMTR